MVRTIIRGSRLALKVLLVALYVGWVGFVVATPLLGAWLSSSLAAYQNGPVWASALIGLALFPLLPLAWDRLSTWLRDRKNPDRKRWLTFFDRLILRTLVINLGFLAAVLFTYPEAGFRALSARGDWMLDGRDGPTANYAREQLFDLADKLEWLYRSQRDNPYRQYADDDDDDDIQPAPNPVPIPDAPDTHAVDDTPDSDDSSSAQPDANPDSADEQPGREARPQRGYHWPMQASLHPVIREIPERVETDYASVARYISVRESDPYLRVKALHDYVADRIAYDAPALAAGEYPPQDAETVFRTRLAVCAGYSKLLQAMGKAIGEKIVYVVGDARSGGGEVDGAGHAWNAVEIEGRWYLIDVTWNSGTVNDDVFTRGYRTDYFLTPPEVFGLDHLPDDNDWQLRESPLSRGEFMRQPLLRPAFYAQGLRLVSPKRSQVTVEDVADITLENRGSMHIMGRLAKKGSNDKIKCDVVPGKLTRITCPISASGTYRVKIFTGKKRYGTYLMVGELEVNSR